MTRANAEIHSWKKIGTIALHQATQSAFRRQLKIVGAQADGQPANSNLDGDHVFTRLPQADSSQDERVHIENDGNDSSSKKIIQTDNHDDERFFSATTKTLNTVGQLENLKTDVVKEAGQQGPNQESKGSGEHKRKKLKVTFAQLLEKYQKVSEENSSYRSAQAKASKSPQGINLRSRIGEIRS